MDTTMTSHDRRPPHPTWRPVEPPVRVRIDGDCVIITTGPLDHDATVALAEAIEVTIATGSTAVLDLEDDPERPTIGQPSGPIRSGRRPAPRPHAVALGPGLLQVSTASQPWTIDVPGHRLCRTHGMTDRLFLPTSAWIGIRAISISPLDVVAITTSGEHLATYRQPGIAT